MAPGRGTGRESGQAAGRDGPSAGKLRTVYGHGAETCRRPFLKEEYDCPYLNIRCQFAVVQEQNSTRIILRLVTQTRHFILVSPSAVDKFGE